MGTLLLTMLMIVCHISLLLALCLPSQSVLREDQSREDSWPAQPQDFYFRFVAKRDNFIANQIEDSNNERCLLHRYTLMELNLMMEEEVRVFTECLAGVEEDK